MLYINVGDQALSRDLSTGFDAAADCSWTSQVCNSAGVCATLPVSRSKFCNVTGKCCAAGAAYI